MKFQICAISDRPGFSKVLATVEAGFHGQAAARYWKIPEHAVMRMSGWGGQNGRFVAVDPNFDAVYVKRVVPR